ncbi:MAG TPA: DUF4337 domain-containing protein [Terriglobales bacterium]|jgi:hypothetical protein
MNDELQELQEHAEHARHNPSLVPVSLTMAILAVVVATVTLLGHRAHTEEVVLQNKVSDEWAFYQAKNIRKHTDEALAEMSTFVSSQNAAASAKFQQKYQTEADRYANDQKEAEATAHELEQETDHERRRADRYDLGEVFLEIGLVITSITLLSGRAGFWHLGMALGVVGIVTATTGLFLS